jgi:class 3 adenylate cyclase
MQYGSVEFGYAEPFANALVEDPSFRAWVLRQTKFADFAEGARILHEDPIPVDNPALQAVQMALEMRTAIGALTGKWRRLGHEIGFGIGVAHGFATLGTIGFEGRFDYAAIGTVSNVASRAFVTRQSPAKY